MDQENFKKIIAESIELKEKLLGSDSFLESVQKALRLINDCYKSKHKLLIAGNGGSAADAQHFAGEIVGRFKKERRGYPAIALASDSSVMTAWANDYSYDTVFSRQVEALGTRGDIFFGISTSGNSKNVIEAVRRANSMGLKTVGLLGNNGGVLKKATRSSIVVPSNNVARIQEIHILTIHYLCEKLEENFR